ncbi:transcription initiation factor TFIID subunit 6 [Saccharata proteae CBS 121410]|uniref:TBP-associated factor 6 n=1 Tax=Saccharata proteae CBS 121410 TaxID=1314787 RepID=A0A9P4M152_9PEZI|nr:transcription initiation factor TFIID subunit 6 [Saccharata proteae CBS 121410]
MASVWNPDNIKDIAESVGIASLSDDVAEELTRDVEFRIGQALEEALKFMRHAKRTTLGTQDISQALRVLGIEPLYGYESTRPLRFGEASMGPGQPLFYVEDEEVDFEKLINAPLPKVPKEISFTAHWLALEGVQPAIPQNPTSADSRHQDLLPKGPGANPHIAAANGYDNVAVKPLVKHVISKELQLYFDRIVSALADETNEEWRAQALGSLRTDPGLHQLVPYFVQYVSEKVTHNMKDLFILTQMMHLTAALLTNPSLYMDAYITGLVAPVLTCLMGKRLGGASETTPLAHFALRDLAGDIIVEIAKRYGNTSQTLKKRLAQTLLKKFLDDKVTSGAHYGAILGLQGIMGPDGVRLLILPNLKLFDVILKERLADENAKAEAEMVVMVILKGLKSIEKRGATLMTNGTAGGEETKSKVAEKVGEVIGEKVIQLGRPRLIEAVLDANVTL